MAERGAVPKVPEMRRRVMDLVRSFTSPLLPDDYLELVNPLWSTRELRGRVERVERETSKAVTVLIKPGWEWAGHRPGQYIRLGIAVDGIHHWRAYSLTSEPRRADGCISITPKLVEGGKVSPFLNGRVRPGAIVRLGGVEGTFLLPDPLPRKLLFISAGSGITPIMSMLRSIAAEEPVEDVVHVHCAHSVEDVIFGRELQDLDMRHPGYRLHLRLTGEQGRVTPEQLDELCPDWGEREAFVCGPAGLLDAMGEHWKAKGDEQRLHVERGTGGEIHFCSSGVVAQSDGEQPILAAGEMAGGTLPYGCRMGICHTCVGKLKAGKVRDLRTGRVHGAPGEMVRTCVNAPEGAVEIDL
jgi:stearoyl-CoA 9-desaturase NADPH oxidoreductase